MTAFTVISNALVAVGAKPFATTMQALRDNLIAAFEGDATAVAAGVTLRDAALNTGAATAAGTTWVGLRTADLAAGAVGSYALMGQFTALAAPVGFGTTRAGSSLSPAGLASNGGILAIVQGSPTQAGTWRCMGHFPASSAAVPTNITLWLRIS